MTPRTILGAVLALSLLALPTACRTVGTAVGTAGRVAGDTASAAGRAAGTAASGAGAIVEDTAKEADREVRGK